MRYLTYLFLFMGLAACQPKPTFQIIGKFDKELKSKSVDVFTPQLKRDTAKLSGILNEDGNFKIKGDITSGTMFEVCLKKDYIEIPVYAENQIYTLVQDNNNYYLIPEDTNSLQYRFVTFRKGLDRLTKEYEQLCIGYDTISDIQAKALRSGRLSEKFRIKNGYILDGIRDFKGTEISQYLACEILFFLEHDYKTFTKVMKLLGDGMPDNAMKTKLTNSYNEATSNQLTGIAPDFELPDIQGKKYSLSSFRGKYVLIDFWASWCAPCRTKNKELNKYYPELESQGLQVISISLDDDKSKWKKAVKEDQVCWLQLADLNGFKDSSIRENYKVKQVPTVFLIAPDGTVIKTNPSFEEIIKELKN